MSDEVPVCLLGAGLHAPKGVLPPEDFMELSWNMCKHAQSELDPSKPAEKERIDALQEHFEWFEKITFASKIKKRHFFNQDGDVKKMMDWYKNAQSDYSPSVNERMAVWRKSCPDMAIQASRDCLKQWGDTNFKRIKHVVTHSTTGWTVPGVGHHIIWNLDLEPDTRPTSVNYAGCHGGINALYVARAIAINHGDELVLMTCVEDPTLLFGNPRFNASLERSCWTPAVLFGAASGSVLVGRPSAADLERSLKPGGFSLWEMTNMGTEYLPATRDVLGMSVSDEYNQYYTTTIKRQLPVHLNNALSKNLRSWVQKTVGVPIVDCDFAVHPGGRLLLDNFAKLLQGYGVKDGKEAIKHCYYNMNEYGNLSSASVLMIMKNVCLDTAKDNIYVMAMGPGVTIEYGGLKRYTGGPGSAKKKSKSADVNYFIVAIAVVLIALLFSGTTLQDVLAML